MLLDLDIAKSGQDEFVADVPGRKHKTHGAAHPANRAAGPSFGRAKEPERSAVTLSELQAAVAVARERSIQHVVPPEPIDEAAVSKSARIVWRAMPKFEAAVEPLFQLATDVKVGVPEVVRLVEAVATVEKAALMADKDKRYIEAFLLLNLAERKQHSQSKVSLIVTVHFN